MSRTEENLKIAFSDECQTNIEYLAYAHRALEEGYVEIAQLFREAAGAEVVHALNHLKTMEVVRNTSENLREAAEGGGIGGAVKLQFVGQLGGVAAEQQEMGEANER